MKTSAMVLMARIWLRVSMSVVAWIWVIGIWLNGCWASASDDRIGWLILWVIFPPLAWLFETLTTLWILIVGSPYPRGITAFVFFYFTGWIWLFVMEDKLGEANRIMAEKGGYVEELTDEQA